MEQLDFSRELAKYPIVRDSAWRGTLSGPETVNRAKSVAVNAATPSPSKLGGAELQQSYFWPALRTFFQQHYNPECSEALSTVFQMNYSQIMAELSLDDIELLASRIDTQQARADSKS